MPFWGFHMFFRCTSEICGAKYEANTPLEACPRCRSPVVVGIDFFDVLNQDYEIIEE